MKRILLAAPIVLGLVFLGALLAQAPAKGKNYAFLVACGEYDNDNEFGKLPYTIKELLEFRDVLVASGDFKEADIKLLHNDLKEKRYQPRRKRILDELDILLERLNEEDTLLVVFNGHGIQPKDDPVAYFCPIDASVDDKKTCIALEGKEGIFEKLKETKLKRKLLIVNACRDDPNGKPTMAARKVDLFDKKHKYESPKGIAALFSCQAGQFSYYYPDDKETKGRHRSLFFHHLIEAWKGEYSTDKGKDISLEDVFREVKDRTSAEADKLFVDRQVPFMRREYEKDWTIRRSVEVLVKQLSPKTFPSMKLVRIPAKGKTFTMGSPESEEGRFKNETEHTVTLSADYYLGVMTVTRGQFRKFVNDINYQTEAESDGKGGSGYDAERRVFLKDAKYTWRDTGFYQDDEHPVVNVSWNDAQAFCKWLSGKEGKEYRLPTEAEWEYACRAGSKTRFYFGDDENELKEHANVADRSLKAKWDYSGFVEGDYKKSITAWFARVSWDDGYPFTAPVGKFKPNGYGLHDMHGNVWQWCSDVYGEYPAPVVTDPTGPAPKGGSYRVDRGGSWSNEPQYCRSADRDWNDPSFRFYSIGFRLSVPVR